MYEIQQWYQSHGSVERNQTGSKVIMVKHMKFWKFCVWFNGFFDIIMFKVFMDDYVIKIMY